MKLQPIGEQQSPPPNSAPANELLAVVLNFTLEMYWFRRYEIIFFSVCRKNWDFNTTENSIKHLKLHQSDPSPDLAERYLSDPKVCGAM